MAMTWGGGGGQGFPGSRPRHHKGPGAEGYLAVAQKYQGSLKVVVKRGGGVGEVGEWGAGR